LLLKKKRRQKITSVQIYTIELFELIKEILHSAKKIIFIFFRIGKEVGRGFKLFHHSFFFF